MSQCEYGAAHWRTRLLGALEHFGIPATFFIPGYIAEHHPRMVEAIVARGHQVGLHGYLHEKLALSPRQKKNRFSFAASKSSSG